MSKHYEKCSCDCHTPKTLALKNPSPKLEAFAAHPDRYGFGFDELAEILQRHGQGVLDLIIEGLELGLSKDLLIKVLQFLGPLILDLVVTATRAEVNAKAGKRMHGPVSMRLRAKAQEGGLFVGEQIEDKAVQAAILEDLLGRVIELIFGQFGDQLIEALIKWLLDNLGQQGNRNVKA